MAVVCCACIVIQDEGASKDASYGNVAMQGQEVFKFAVRSVPTVIEAALKQVGLCRLVEQKQGLLHGSSLRHLRCLVGCRTATWQLLLPAS